MGLYVHSLSRLPLGVERNYYLYVLDYGWDEPLGASLRRHDFWLFFFKKEWQDDHSDHK